MKYCVGFLYIMTNTLSKNKSVAFLSTMIYHIYKNIKYVVDKRGHTMKKYIALIFISLFCLTSCAQQTTPQQSNVSEDAEQNTEENTEKTTEDVEQTIEENAVTDENGTTYTKSFGTYTVPTGWIESTTYSTSDKFFYVADGTEENALPNNISINMGTNKYSADDHVSFRQAIMNQLVMQLPKDTMLNGSGSYTANDSILYTFTFSITENDTTLNATQYYIVGDHKYIMVYESVYDGNTEEVDAIAKNIVDTFQWSE